MPSQPNIVFICTDQQFAGAMSCAGNADLSTPNMDRLAARGVRFDKAYCTQPLCTPSRASLFSGFMPHTIDCSMNGNGIPESRRDKELGTLIEAAGYKGAYGGKWHVPESVMPEAHGFETICDFHDLNLAGACIDFIRRDHDKPFFLVASFDNPHNICEWARQQRLPWGEIESAVVEDCPHLPANFPAAPYEPDIIRIEQAGNLSVHPTSNFTPDDWRRYRHAYYRLCEKVDAEIGRILDALDEAGLTDDTLIIFTSDHGDGHGAHGWNQKTALFEEVIRIPLIVAGPGIAAGRVESESLVSNGLDLLPTLCDYADADTPADLPGRSLRPLLDDASNSAATKASDWRDELVVETMWYGGGPSRGSRGRALRTERYKYVIYEIGKHREQLFDLDNDPGEMINRAVDARYKDVLDDHRKRFVAWAESTNDYFRGPVC